MANNLHISYDLYASGQNYTEVIERIKQLGEWAKVHQSFWYVNSSYTAAEAASHVWAAMDANDTLYVVDATNNQASWRNLSEEVKKFIIDRWLK